MRWSGDTLRTRVGYDTLVVRHVDSIDLADVDTIEVVAPYAPPSPRLSLVVFGIAFGLLGGSFLDFNGACTFGIMTTTFALVGSLIGGSSTARQRLARMRMKTGKAHTIAYRYEEEQRVKARIGIEKWNEDANMLPDSPLERDEQRHIDSLRVGIVLATSAVALLVLWSNGPHFDESSPVVSVPVNILEGTAWVLAIGVGLMAWYRVFQARMK